MITVAGFNTAVDKFVEVDALRVGGISRASTVKPLPGGKGLHVALTVAALGEPVTLIGLIDPGQRGLFDTFLRDRGVTFHPVVIPESIRTCLSIRDGDGRVTELREAGPTISPDIHRQLLAAMEQFSADGGVTVLSGSVPPGSPETTYRDLVAALSARGTRCLVDAGGALLRHALEARPYAIKPNRDEAGELLGRPVITLHEARAAAAELLARGPALVALSLGEAGLLAASAHGLHHVHAPPRSAAHAVGSGDCLLGGLAVGLQRGLPIEETLRLAVACGTANTLTTDIGMVRRADVDTILPEVTAS